VADISSDEESANEEDGPTEEHIESSTRDSMAKISE